MADERVLVVTGGTRGIGAAVVKQAARKGYSIAINYRSDEEKAQETAEMAKAEGAPNAGQYRADVSDSTSVKEMFDLVEAELGSVTDLVTCAGINEGNPKLVREYEPDVLERVVQVNVLGTMFPVREALRRMSTGNGGNGGNIVNVSSMATTIGGRQGRRVYAASKGAVDVFTLGVAKEAAREGVRVNAVRPGVVATSMNKALMDDEEAMEKVTSSIAMNRVAHPAEIAAAVMWLLCDEASFASGTLMDLSGGGFII